MSPAEGAGRRTNSLQSLGRKRGTAPLAAAAAMKAVVQRVARASVTGQSGRGRAGEEPPLTPRPAVPGPLSATVSPKRPLRPFCVWLLGELGPRSVDSLARFRAPPRPLLVVSVPGGPQRVPGFRISSLGSRESHLIILVLSTWWQNLRASVWPVLQWNVALTHREYFRNKNVLLSNVLFKISHFAHFLYVPTFMELHSQ